VVFEESIVDDARSGLEFGYHRIVIVGDTINTTLKIQKHKAEKDSVEKHPPYDVHYAEEFLVLNLLFCGLTKAHIYSFTMALLKV